MNDMEAHIVAEEETPTLRLRLAEAAVDWYRIEMLLGRLESPYYHDKDGMMAALKEIVAKNRASASAIPAHPYLSTRQPPAWSEPTCRSRLLDATAPAEGTGLVMTNQRDAKKAVMAREYERVTALEARVAEAERLLRRLEIKTDCWCEFPPEQTADGPIDHDETCVAIQMHFAGATPVPAGDALAEALAYIESIDVPATLDGSQRHFGAHTAIVKALAAPHVVAEDFLAEAELRAIVSEHRAVGGIEADNEKSLFHGFCRVCVQPWPCRAATNPAAYRAGASS